MSGERDRVFSQLHATGWNAPAASIHPLYHMIVGPAETIVTVDLPYVDQKQVKVHCPTNDSVEIYAETNRKISFKDLGAKHRHGEFTCYHAIIQIPFKVDEKKITSRFKGGVLKLHVPRLR